MSTHDYCCIPDQVQDRPELISIINHPQSAGHVRKATHFTGQTAACKILPSIDESVAITKDSLLDALEAQKEEILLKIMNGLRIEGVVGIDMVKEEKQWR